MSGSDLIMFCKYGSKPILDNGWLVFNKSNFLRNKLVGLCTVWVSVNK